MNNHRFLALMFSEGECHTVKLDVAAPDDVAQDEIKLAAHRLASTLALSLDRSLGWVMTEEEFEEWTATASIGRADYTSRLSQILLSA
jgi:hypothetical protein